MWPFAPGIFGSPAPFAQDADGFGTIAAGSLSGVGFV